MWIPKFAFDLLVSIGPKFEAIERALRGIEGNTNTLHTLQRHVEDTVAAVRLQHTQAETVAHRVSEDIRELIVDRDALTALEAELQAHRARVVQQETSIKMLLTQLELSGAREAAIFAHLGVLMRLPVQAHVPGAPTTHAIAPAGVTDSQGVPRDPYLDVSDAMKVLQAQIRETQGSSAPMPSAAGTPGTLPENLFDDIGDGAADAPARDDVPDA